MLMFVHLVHVDLGLGTPTTPPPTGPSLLAAVVRPVSGVARTSSLGCTRVAVSRALGGLTGTVVEEEADDDDDKVDPAFCCWLIKSPPPSPGAVTITAAARGLLLIGPGAALADDDGEVDVVVVIVEIVESVMIFVTVLTSAMGRVVHNLKSSTASGRFAAMFGHH